jgi:hypothetical protein
MYIPSYYALADMTCSKLVLSGVSNISASASSDIAWLDLSGTAYLRMVVYDNSSSAVPSSAWSIASADSKICSSDGVFLKCASVTGSTILDDQHHHLTYTTNSTMQIGGALEQTASLSLRFDEDSQVQYDPPYRILIEDSFAHVFSIAVNDTNSTEVTTATWNSGVSYTFPAIGPGETTEAQLIPPPSGGDGTLRRVSGAATGMSVRFNDTEEPDTLTINQGQSTQVTMAATADATPGEYSRLYEATLNCP